VNRKVLIAVAVSTILVAMVFSGASIPYPGHNITERLITGTDHHNHGNGTSNNKTITAMSEHNFTLKGNLSDCYNNLPVKGIIIIKNSTMSRTINAGKNGSYNITLPGGNYTIEGSSLGFGNRSMPLYLNSNKTENISITPLKSIGNNINLFTNETEIESNSKNISNIVPYLKNNETVVGLNNNNITGTLNKNITIELGNKLADTQFLILIEQNGGEYNYTGTTNSTGNSTLSLEYAGNYTMAAYTLHYNSSFIKYNTAGDRPVKFKMLELTNHKYTIQLRSAVKFNNSYEVGNSTLYGHGGIFNVNYTNIIENMSGTYYHYLVPSGFYNFKYENVNYVTKLFNFHAENKNMTEIINPYLISVNITNNSGESYNYTVGGYSYNSNGTYLATSGTNRINIDINGNVMKNKSVTLYPSNPYYALNFTINKYNTIMTGKEYYSNGYVNITYSGNITSNISIVSMQFENYTTDVDGVLTISGINGNYSTGENYSYNFTPPVYVSAGYVMLKLVYSNVHSFAITGQMEVIIAGYNISASGNYIAE
jgi:hypothetical protein